MHAAIVCPGCQHSHAVTEQVRGKTVRCPSCGTKFTVPAEEAPPPPEEVAIPQAVALPDEPSSEEIVYMAEEVSLPPEEPTATADDSASQVPAGQRPSSDAAEDGEAAWVLPAEKLPRPGAVWAVAIALLLLLAGELAGGYLNYSTSPRAILIRLGFSLPFCCLFLVGIWFGSRLAWLGCRIVAPLAGSLQALGIVVLFVWLMRLPAGAFPELPKNFLVVLGILITELGMLAIIFLDLGQSAARRYFGLVCPACGSRRCRAEDFWFRRVHCRSCHHEWTAAQTARMGRLENHAAMSATSLSRGNKEQRRKRPAAPARARSRMWVAASAAVLGVGLMAGLGYVAVTRLLPAFRQEVDASAWRDFSPPGGNFKIEMPGTPKYTQQVQSIGRDKLQVHTHEVVLKSPERSFGVSYSDYPEWVIRQRPVEPRLDGSRDGAVQAIGGKLRSEKRLIVGGFPARELEIEIPNKGTVMMRLHAVNQRIFILQVIGPRLKPDAPEVRRFFNSFQLQAVRSSTPPVPANRPNQPRPQVPQQPPESPAPLYVPTPVQPVVIKPPMLSGNRVTVPLLGQFRDVAVGGGGRFLIFYLPARGKLEIFDVNQAKLVKDLHLGDPQVFFAAGMDKLIVALPRSRQLVRYSLLTFQQEAAAPFPIPPNQNLLALALGSASNGPLLIGSATNNLQSEISFFDIIGMKKVSIPIKSRVPGVRLRLRAEIPVRASADGRVFCIFERINTLSYVLRGQEIHLFQARGMGGIPVPGPDGEVLFTPQGLFTNELKPITAEVRNGIPAHHGPYFLSFHLSTPEPGGGNFLSLHRDRNPQSLVKVPDIDLKGLRPGAFQLEKRIHLIPDAKLLITLPPPDNQLVLHRFDAEAALANAP